ncbi:MAG: uroporphyrinogen decarboxylase [Chloroflexi bacterium]|nr:uroporphyrinogen decarboxylase [Chloroflexota bacterium]
MNHRQRINAVLRGEPTDRIPVALWRHFPNDDQSAETLAARVVEFQKKFEFDFVKVTPASGYPAEIFGATFVDAKNREGTRSYTSRPVSELSDWDKLQSLDTTNPVFVRELAALKLIREQLGPDVHILQTIFSPLNSALNIAGERLYADMREQPDVLHRGLRAITETTNRFAVESLRAGADAIFFATQMATPTRLSLGEFRAFGEPYDFEVLQAIRTANPDFIFLHIHGLEIYFDVLRYYPVEILNWHDRRTEPSLKQAREILNSGEAKNGRAVAGGIDEWNVLAAKSPDDVKAQVYDAVTQAGKKGFILAAGCVIAVDTPEENIRAVIDTART